MTDDTAEYDCAPFYQLLRGDEDAESREAESDEPEREYDLGGEAG